MKRVISFVKMADRKAEKMIKTIANNLSLERYPIILIAAYCKKPLSSKLEVTIIRLSNVRMVFQSTKDG